MAEKMLMLALSPTMEQGVIAKWRKAQGDAVESGEVVCDVETDKAVMEYESQTAGTLLKITVPEGSSAAVGEIIAVVGEPDEDVSAIVEEANRQQQAKGEKKEEKNSRRPHRGRQKEQEDEPVDAKPEPAQAPPMQTAGKKVLSSPLARRVADEKGIDISRVKGSGPQGRVVEADVLAAAEKGVAQPAAPVMAGQAMQQEEIPISQKRRVIAQRLSDSKHERPHYYLTVSAQVDDLLAARKVYNANAAEKLSFNAYLVKLTAEALRRHRMVNATWNDDAIILHGRVDVALAVSQPDGLITPVLRNCEQKGIVQIDRELKELIAKAQAGTLQPEEYSESTFTITNLGSFGIEEFTAIINPPNSAILAVGQTKPTPVVDASGSVVVAQIMKLTLSCDHRLVDGATGARFLTELKAMIEQPVAALY